MDDLKKKIRELEEELDSKEIMIDLLLNEVKKSREVKRRKISILEREDIIEVKNKEIVEIEKEDIVETKECKKIEQNKIEIAVEEPCIQQYTNSLLPTNGIVLLNNSSYTNESSLTKVLSSPTRTTPKEYSHFEEEKVYNLKSEIDALFNRKRVTKLFKENTLIDEFVSFCEYSYTIKTFKEPIQISHSRLIQKYLHENKHRIFKYLMINIDRLSLFTLSSTLLALSTEYSEEEKLVLIHDIILYTDTYSKILVLSFSLINNSDFLINIDDVFKQSIYSILNWQYLVDTEIYKNDKSILVYLNFIRKVLRIDNAISLENILNNINTNIQVINNNKIDDSIYKYIYSVRVLGHYLDWDYTYNVYIQDLINKRSAGVILYLGILGLNALRVCGVQESTKCIFEYLESLMVDCNVESVVCYLFVKQVNQEAAYRYLLKNKEGLISEGYNLEYLKSLVLI